MVSGNVSHGGCALLFHETRVVAIGKDERRLLRKSTEIATCGNVINDPLFFLVPPLCHVLSIWSGSEPT